jgi:ribosomal-protein-alanine N-acetyltransferase
MLGVFNLSQIFRGNFRSAYLGYYGHAAFVGQGYMREGLELVVRYAFAKLGLHRIEANIQPGNLRSRALVERCGFVKEGFSPRYLKVAGRWRDHERWAITLEGWRVREATMGVVSKAKPSMTEVARSPANRDRPLARAAVRTKVRTKA